MYSLSEFLHVSGASPGIGRGGGKNFFLRLGNLHDTKRHAAHGAIKIKMVQFGAFWCIFCSDFVFKNFKNYHFLYKNLKNCNILYKRINILDTRNIILVKKILKIYD